MRFRAALLAAVASLTMTAAANAVPVVAGSQISFSDGANYSSTAITFSNGGVANLTLGAATGSFSSFSAGCIGCAHFSDFTFSPFVSPTTVYTATSGGVTTAFTLTSLSSSSVTALTLNLMGTGTVTLTGFDPTPGIFLLSSQGPQGTNVTFSATTLATATTVLSQFRSPCSALGLSAWARSACVVKADTAPEGYWPVNRTEACWQRMLPACVLAKHGTLPDAHALLLGAPLSMQF